MPKISIIIPSYNRGNLISDSIESVLAQSYRDFEILIIDDGSTDYTKEVLKKYSNDIKYIYIEHTGLPSVTRNVGIKNATGEYIAFLDSDDIWLPEKLEKEMNILENNPDMGLVCSNAYIIKPNKSIINELYLKNSQTKKGKVIIELLKDNFIITSSVIVRRSALDKSGIFSEESGIRALEDYYLWLNIALITNIYYIPEALVQYRDHIGSIRTQQTIMSYINARLYILKQIRSRILIVNDQDINMKNIIDDIDYCIALFEYDILVIKNNKTLSIRGLTRLVLNRPRNIFVICRYIVIRLMNRRKYNNIINFVSPWTSGSKL